MTSALDAAVVLLCLLSAPGLPPGLYLDEFVERAVGLLKYHLQYNALVAHDPRFRRMYRQGASAAADGGRRLGVLAGRGGQPAGSL